MINRLNIHLFTILNLLTVAACTAVGIAPNLANDCRTQSATIFQGAAMMDKLTTSERTAIDADISLSKGYCSGTLPADETAASKAVEAATAKITAVIGVAALRNR